jgi:hypothetical protein
MSGSAWNSGTCDGNRPEGKKVYAYTPAVNGSHPREKVDLIATGKAETDFARQSRTTAKITYAMPDGTRKQTNSTSEVVATQMEKGPLTLPSSKSLLDSKAGATDRAESHVGIFAPG